MKIACNKCEKVKDSFWTKDWLKIRVDDETYMLCEKCKAGFFMAVDSGLPPIVREED